ncbi:MAG: molybdenum cofactor guanylyltransferase MobA [Pseudomonadota bacterium]|nr:molybdenum cofactor guanylyltransferase MobA [Pseudomonadota bacterium]
MIRIPTDNITAVVLAGGRGRRLGGRDKGLVELGGKTLVEHVLDAIRPQVRSVLINANRNLETYSGFGYPVINDEMADFQGPLAGLAAGLSACDTDYVVTLPCDGPYVPADLVARLARALVENDAEIAVAHDGRRMQPVYALVPRALRPSLQAFLDAGDRKVELWYARHAVAMADFSDVSEAFININTEAERHRVAKGNIPA